MVQEKEIWELIEAHQGEQFYTMKRLPFVYEIRGGECFINRRQKSITRATFEKAYGKIQSAGEEKIRGPKQLGVFGAPYVWAIFRQLGLA